MSTQLNINFLRTGVLDSAVGTISKLIVSADKVLDIKSRDSDGQILNRRYDFSAALSKRGSCESPNGYNDLIYRVHAQGLKVILWVACVVPDNTPVPVPDYQEITVTEFPNTVFLAEGVTDGVETITNGPDWVAGLSNITYAEKQKRAIVEINNMFEVKESDIERASRALDLNPELPKHVAYWWRSAVAVIKHYFQDPNTDPLIVEAMAKQAGAGPTTRGDRLTLLRNLNTLSARYPNGPDFAAVWVETQNLTTPADVTRKTISEVLQTRGTNNDETLPLASDFDSTDESWVVANQPGIVTYNIESPSAGQNVIATLVDYDGGVTNISYQWQTLTNNIWQDEITMQDMVYNNIVTGSHRAKITYDDNYRTGNLAIGATIEVV